MIIDYACALALLFNTCIAGFVHVGLVLMYMVVMKEAINYYSFIYVLKKGRLAIYIYKCLFGFLEIHSTYPQYIYTDHLLTWRINEN